MSAKVIETENNFKRVRSAITGSALMDAAMSGGRVVQSYAKNDAPKDIANLANSIAAQPAEQAPTLAWVQIGTDVVYAQIQELGGIIRPKVAKMLSWIAENGERVFARVVQIKAQPYLRPAMDKHHSEILGAVGEAIRSALEKATK